MAKSTSLCCTWNIPLYYRWIWALLSDGIKVADMLINQGQEIWSTANILTQVVITLSSHSVKYEYTYCMTSSVPFN